MWDTAKELMAENLPHFSENVHLQIQEDQLMSKSIKSKRTVPSHIAMKLEK